MDFLKNEYLKEITLLKKGIVYCDNCIKETNEKWVKKEYESGKETSQLRITEIETILNNW